MSTRAKPIRQRLCGVEGCKACQSVISHRETRTVVYPAELMFAVVADVEKYPEFLPWVVALRVLSRREG